jgi:hypothetical protein
MREQEIERIAQEEIYPERHGRKFAEWPSKRTHEVHLAYAEQRYNQRQAEARAKVAKTVKKKATASKEIDEGDDE